MGVKKTVKQKSLKLMKPPSKKTAKLFEHLNCKKEASELSKYEKLK